MDIVNIAAYRFAPIADPAGLRAPLKAVCNRLALKGTVLLAPEGINLFLAGTRTAVDTFLATMRDDVRFHALFAELPVKESLSAAQPFRRMLVRLKKEIITMRQPALAPAQGRAPAVAAATLSAWLEAGHDEAGRPVVLLDTRNDFETALGSFEHAVTLDLKRFSDFPAAFQAALDAGRLDPATQQVVTFCTGGIRCEKAALYLAEQGVPHVTQLDGGILKYFEDVGGAHWRGECFVFDDRVALACDLRPTDTVQCYACRAVVSAHEQLDARYVRGASCPHCATVSADAAAHP